MSSSGLSDFGWYGVTGASLSVMLAGVKEFEGPVAGVRIASDEAGNFVFDPTFEQLQKAHLDLTVAGTLDAITMVESQGYEVSNELMVKAFEYAHSIIRELCHAQKDFMETYMRTYALPETTLTVVDTDNEVLAKVRTIVTEAQIKAVYNLGKLEFHDAMHDLVESVKMRLVSEFVSSS
jgi:polyribonucleotide nucleotidyltransferase